MSVPHNTLPRRDFLGTLIASTTVGIAGLAIPREFGIAGPSFPSPETSGFEAWLGKIKGKHKQVFDAPMPHGGLPFAWSRVFLMTNKALGVADADVKAVLILRHDAIPLGMESSLWDKYKFGEFFDIKDEASKAPLTMNPFWKPKEGSLPLPGMSVDALLGSGVLIGICDMAMTFYSMKAAEKTGMKAEDIKKDWVGGVFPGIQVVPSGVLAINRAQEHGCTYCYAG
jgi:intracellular sulfur oxidation DsrE/DsrF family protein